jgi:DNA-binding MarR family transcriptional regulator
MYARRLATQGRLLRELAIVEQLVTTRLNRALRPLSLTTTHLSVLLHLASVADGCSVSEIAEAMEINQPAVSKTLQSLNSRQAVVISADAADARRRVVRLSSQGQALLTDAAAAMAPDANLTFAPLSDTQLHELGDLLAQLRVVLEAAR